MTLSCQIWKSVHMLTSKVWGINWLQIGQAMILHTLKMVYIKRIYFFFQFVKYLKTAKIRKRKNREERQNPGRFFHFAPPDRLGWLRYWHSEKKSNFDFFASIYQYLFPKEFSRWNESHFWQKVSSTRRNTICR